MRRVILTVLTVITVGVLLGGAATLIQDNQLRDSYSGVGSVSLNEGTLKLTRDTAPILITPVPTATATATQTGTPTATATPTFTPSPSPAPTPPHSGVGTVNINDGNLTLNTDSGPTFQTMTATASGTPSPTPTQTATPDVIANQAAWNIVLVTSSPTSTPTAVPTRTPAPSTPTVTPSQTPASTATPTASPTPSGCAVIASTTSVENCDSTYSNLCFILPTSSGDGKQVTLNKVDTSLHACTLYPGNGYADTIQGATNPISMTQRGARITVVSDTSGNWTLKDPTPTNFYSNCEATFGTAVAWSANTANRPGLLPIYIPAPVQFGHLNFNVSTADNSGNLYDFGIYNAAQMLLANVGPTYGSVIFPTTGLKSVALNQGTVILMPGVYAFGIISSAFNAAAPAVLANCAVRHIDPFTAITPNASTSWGLGGGVGNFGALAPILGQAFPTITPVDSNSGTQPMLAFSP